jgi:hypothetical protein
VLVAFSRQASQVFRNTYTKSKDLIDTVADQSGELYGDLRRWVPEHRTAVAWSAAAAVGMAGLGYLIGRGRAAEAAEERRSLPAVRMPELDIAPFFKFVSLWMLYRVATRD